jgi:hypothetical protein
MNFLNQHLGQMSTHTESLCNSAAHRGSRRLDAARKMKHEANVKDLVALILMETRTLA